MLPTSLDIPYQTLFSAIPDALLIFDPQSLKIVDCNQTALDLYGYDRESFVGIKVTDISSEPEATKASVEAVFRGEFNHISLRWHHTRSGQEFPVSISLGRLDLEPRSLMVGIIRDLTQTLRREKEKQDMAKKNRQAEKVRALGVLSGGIAHDFNNILWAILLNTELSMADQSASETMQSRLRKIKQSCLRARDLIQQILTFGRKAEKELMPLKLGPVIKETMKLMRATLPANIRVEMGVAGDRDWVLADPSLVEQAVTHLCTNAAEAMRERGGVLDIQLSCLDLEVQDLSRHPELEPGSYVRVVIRDTGVGISPDHLDRIFEPYFTTRSLAESSGLGLSVVHGIVQTLHGSIAVQSEQNQGSTFEILLPKLKSREISQASSPLPPTKPETSTRILLVEDDAFLGEATQAMLEDMGYSTRLTINGEDAWDAFEKDPEQFDLVITDLTMPGMNGRQLARKIHVLRPSTPILLCTGYLERVPESQASQEGICATLIKPVERAVLAHAITQALNPAPDERPAQA